MGPTPALTTDSQGRRVYVRAVGPRLQLLLWIVFFLVAILAANAAYLASITFLEWYTGLTYQDYFYQLMFLVHLAVGLLLIVPFLAFGIIHMLKSWNRRNRRAVRIGYALFACGVTVLVSGLLLMRVSGLELKQPTARAAVYWLHVIAPIVSLWLYWLHRLAGPRIRWRFAMSYAGVVAAIVLGMVALHRQDPRRWNVAGPKEGERYFFPSLARTATGNFIPASTLMMDDYCKKCHEDVYHGWYHSVHHFSSFNNPAYLASVRETREFSLKRDGNVRASRWCAGCHDPVPFFSGAFDDPNFDDVNHETAHAGITCTVCHAITHVNSTRGNSDYTIEEPQHYPFAFSDNPLLQYVNEQLIKAKPSFHKKTFLKPLHKTAEFCSTCHKVHLPVELNDYKFLRGQNHYDTYLLSGVSGHGARSFYYPPKAEENCNGCHMPLRPSNDFGAKFFGSQQLSIHDHLFPSANTAIAYLRNEPEIVKAHQEFLQGVLRVDIFGIKEGGTIDGRLHAPLRPEVPTLKPGEKYLLETVIRTLKMGHPFTQGTTDSNEIWLDVTVKSGELIIARSGAMDEKNEVDRWAHFVHNFVIDKQGNRISRRNPQDIFVPLYVHQIPPGAGQTVHYLLDLPKDLDAPLTVEVKLQYRKFDQEYMDFVTRSSRPGDHPIRGYTPGTPYRNELPVTTLATDTITFPILGVAEQPENAPSPIQDTWQRWNDYGIGLLLTGKAQLRQAEEAFQQVERLRRYDGPLNLARVYFAEGRLDEAVEALRRAQAYDNPPAPPWTVNWLSGLVNSQQGHLDTAIENLRSVLEVRTREMAERGFDFSLDYEVRNDLGQILFQRARQERGESRRPFREKFLQDAVDQFQRTLAIDPENVTAHFNLAQLYAELGNEALAAEHRKLHAKYKPDDNARDIAVRLARTKYPAANLAAEDVAIYPLLMPVSGQSEVAP